jgi:SAM-dependent methyltransferase
MSPGLFNNPDPDGEKTLKVISKAGKFNEWMYQTIAPFCSGKILEIGSGIGNISALFIRDGFSMTLSDLRSHYFEELNQKFGSSPNLENTIILDLIDDNFSVKFFEYKGYFDTIFALNVVEHIKDDSIAINNCRFMLKSGGTLIILVPAYQKLYNQFDINLGHYRRYTIKSLKNLVGSNGFEIIHQQYFNLAGILGWFVSGKILGKQTIPEGQMGLYNSLVPVFKIADKAIFNNAGLSVIVAGKAI